MTVIERPWTSESKVDAVDATRRQLQGGTLALLDHADLVRELMRSATRVEPDANGHTHQLFVSKRCPPAIDAAGGQRPNRPWTPGIVPTDGHHLLPLVARSPVPPRQTQNSAAGRSSGRRFDSERVQDLLPLGLNGSVTLLWFRCVQHDPEAGDIK